jgi:FkbM family methyltransferase
MLLGGPGFLQKGRFLTKVKCCCNHTFLADLIRPDGTVFDLGLGEGQFSTRLAARCGQVFGLEPDPIHTSRLVLPDNVTVLPKALGAERGIRRLHLNREKCSSLHYSDADAGALEVEAITLSDALALTPDERIDLIKIDIEGEEIRVLRYTAPTVFARVVQMTVEFHDFLDPESLPDIRDVINRMERLGFCAIKFSWNTYGDVLFINRKLAELSVLNRWYLVVRYKYADGICRLLNRAFRQVSVGSGNT